MYKLSYDGSFLPFPGVNLISLTPTETTDKWRQLFEFLELQEEIPNNFALLPFQSYHMTFNNLYTQSDKVDETDSAWCKQDKWITFIDENLDFFGPLQHVLTGTIHQFTPSVTISNQTITQGVLQLAVTIPQQQQDAMRAICMEHHISNLMPSFFHITLAYSLTPISVAQADSLKNKINAKIDHLFPGRQTTLSPPSLCYFHDMTAFMKWDATHNPFRLHNPANSIPSEFNTPEGKITAADSNNGTISPYSRRNYTRHSDLKCSLFGTDNTDRTVTSPPAKKNKTNPRAPSPLDLNMN